MGGTTMMEETTAMEETTSMGGGTTSMDSGSTGSASGQVTIGGFTVEGVAGTGNVDVPEVTASQGDVNQYLNQVQPIVTGSIRDVSQVVEPKASIENGRIQLGINVQPIQKARQTAQQGLDDLRQVQPPADLQPIQDRLVKSYENAIPAYENLISAFESGNVDSLNQAVRQSLPKIERAAAVQRAILQDLERATR